MTRAQFLKGAKALIDGREHTFLRQVSPGVWQLEASNTGELRKEPQDQLLDFYLSGRFKFLVDNMNPAGNGKEMQKDAALRQFELLPSDKQNKAKMRRHYVSAILNEVGPTLSKEVVEIVAKQVWEKIHWPIDAQPHFTTLWRWIKRYVSGRNDVRTLVDQVHRCGNQESRLPDKLVEIINESIDAIYMVEEKGTIQDTLDHAITEATRENKLRIASEQLPLPTLRQIKHMVYAIPEFDRYAARHGRLAAERYFRAVRKHTMTSFPLERVEIDHTKIDLFVVDEETMLPLGRPWLTLCIDTHTRAILGFDLSFDPPSYLTVSRCLKMALLPKGNLKEKYPDLKNDWPMYGAMETLVCDNGQEFHSASLEAACLTLGITQQYCPRKRPWYKGIIERMLGTLNRGVAHGVPGTTFSSILEKEEYKSAEKATVTLATLKEIIHVWIIDYYHQRPHRTLGDTPAHAWLTETSGMSIPLPATPAELDAILGKIDTCKLTHRGIEINGLFYNSEEAGALRRRLGTNIDVTVKHHDDNLGSIHVLIPDTQEYIALQAIDFEYADGLSLWQHMVCKRFARRNLKGRTDIVALAEAKRSIREMVEQDFGRKRAKSRMRSQRFRGTTVQKTTPTPATIATIVGTSVKKPPSPSRPKTPALPPQKPVSTVAATFTAIVVDRQPTPAPGL